MKDTLIYIILGILMLALFTFAMVEFYTGSCETFRNYPIKDVPARCASEFYK